MKRLMYILFIFTFMLVNITSCNSTPSQDSQPSGQKNQKVEITLYYANKKYINTGNNNIDKFVAVKKEFPLDLDNESLALKVLEELKKSPGESYPFAVPLPDINVLEVKIEKAIAYVNLSDENLSGSSLQEFFIINQIVYSLIELPDIKQVQFLVNGEKRETLMGHFMIDEPLSP